MVRCLLVNEIKNYKIQLAGMEEEIELKLDFKALIKMHKEYGNAFLLIHSFVFENDLSKLPALIRCMADKELTEEEIQEKMVVNIKSIEVLSNIILDLLNEEVSDVSEFKIKSEVKKNLQ